MEQKWALAKAKCYQTKGLLIHKSNNQALYVTFEDNYIKHTILRYSRV